MYCGDLFHAASGHGDHDNTEHGEPNTGCAGVYCGGDACEDGLLEKPHYHFDYCGPAMITVFVVITGEWVDVTEPVIALEGEWSASFFIVVLFLGKFLLLNLLVAIMGDTWQDVKDQADVEWKFVTVESITE